MSKLAIFIDDHACCAQTGHAGSKTAPTIALSSQVLMPNPAATGKPGALVCDLMHDAGIAQNRLSKDLSADYEPIGLALALEPAAPQHLLERYLTALIGACLRLTDSSGRIKDVVVAIPLHIESPGQQEMILDDQNRVQSALNAMAPLFEGKNFILKDAHELGAKAAKLSFRADLIAGRQVAVIGLWKKRFSMLHITANNNRYGASTFPIAVPPMSVASDAALETQIAKSLSPTEAIRLDDTSMKFRLVPPQMQLGSASLYGNQDTRIAASFRKRYPTTEDFRTEVLPSAEAVQIGSYVLIGSLAINPAIRVGTEGSADSPALSSILGNEFKNITSLNLHPVLSVLDQALKLDIQTTGPAEDAATTLVTSLAGHLTENRTAGIQTVKISKANTSPESRTCFTVKTRANKDPVIEIITLPSDKGYDVIVEYSHCADGAITLKARLDKRVLPLTLAAPAAKDQTTVQADAKLELQQDGSYRLTLDEAHQEACRLRSDLRRLITQGLRLHGSLGKENEEAS